MNNNVMNDTNTEEIAEEITRELVTTNEEVAGVELLESFKDPTGNFYCSIEDDGTRKSKAKIFNAISGTDKQIADHINKEIEIVDVVAHPVPVVDTQTGELKQALRTVLIDKNGVSYSAVSKGIANAISRIMAIVGTPDGGAWKEEPVKVIVEQVQTRNSVNKVNTLRMI